MISIEEVFNPFFPTILIVWIIIIDENSDNCDTNHEELYKNNKQIL